MTDKQIACAFLSEKLRGFIVDYTVLREIAAAKLSESRCERIAVRIIEMADEMRKPLVDHLNRTGCDTF